MSLACLGSGPRVLIGDSVRSGRSLALLEITGPDLRLAALSAPGFTRAIEWQDLPPQIVTEAAVLSRADLVENPIGKLDPHRSPDPIP